MKKLALALMCCASVAFMASCTPEVTNPEPQIAVMTGENYVYDGQTIDLDTDYMIGFRVASNSQTMKELKTLQLTGKIFDLDGTETYSEDTIINITGTEFVYEEVLNLTMDRELVSKVEFSATVTDVDGKMNSTTLNLNVNRPAQPLIGRTFQWYRLGNTITGLDEYGLNWRGNYPRDTYAKLEPQDGVKLFIFDAEDWANTNTDIEKAALFNNAIETMTPAENYFNVNVTQANMTYDDVIGTVMPDGTCHLMHVTKSHAETVTGQGTAVTIDGEAK